MKASRKMLLSDARRPVDATLSNGRHSSREHRRTVEYLGDRSTKNVFLPLATNCSSLQVPPMTKFSWSNPDSSIDQDISYASAAFMAKGSFCKACSLSKLGSRPSYAKDMKETIPFLHRIQGRYLWTYPTIMRTFEIIYGFGGCIDILVTCRFIVHIQCCLCLTPSTTYILKGSPPTSSY